MQSGLLAYTMLEPSDVTAQDFGDVVVLSGAAQGAVAVKEEHIAFGFRFTDVYAKRDGRWQMVTWQSTKLPT